MPNSIKKMDPKQKKIWTTALRSGKFKQGRGSLVRTTDAGKQQHCCLGVAQCVLGERAPREDDMMLRAGRFGLSTKVQEALAAANDGEPAAAEPFKDIGLPMPRLNSRKRATFGAIANWVDKYL